MPLSSSSSPSNMINTTGCHVNRFSSSTRHTASPDSSFISLEKGAKVTSKFSDGSDLACVAGAKRGGRGGGRKARKRWNVRSLPLPPLPPSLFPCPLPLSTPATQASSDQIKVELPHPHPPIFSDLAVLTYAYLVHLIGYKTFIRNFPLPASIRSQTWVFLKSKML